MAKNAIPANFWETYSSFANTDGGTILLGVKEENHKFSVVGVDDARKILTDFWNTVNGDKVGGVVVYERGLTIDAVGGKQIVVAFHMLNRSNRDRSFPHPWGEPSYYDGSDGDDGADDSSAPEEEEPAFDDWDEPPPAPRASWNGRDSGGYGGGSGISNDTSELLNGCLTCIIILIFVIGITVNSCSSS